MIIRVQKYREEKETVLQAYSEVCVLSAGAGGNRGEVGCNWSGLAAELGQFFTFQIRDPEDINTIHSWAVLLSDEQLRD